MKNKPKTREIVKLPLRAGAKIINRNQKRIFTFYFESFPTLLDIKQKIQEKLGIECNDLFLYEFDNDHRYIECLYWGKPLESLPANAIGTVMELILVIRGNVTNDLVQQFGVEVLDELEIPVVGSKTKIKVETLRRSDFIKRAIESKFNIPFENHVIFSHEGIVKWKEFIPLSTRLYVAVIGDVPSEADGWLKDNDITSIKTFKLRFLSM